MKILVYFLGIGLVLFLLLFAGRRWEATLFCRWKNLMVVTTGCMLADAAALTILPFLGLSFGRVMSPLVLFHLFRLALLLPLPVVALLLPRRPTWTVALITAVLLVQCGLSLAAIYGLFIEPFRLDTTEMSIEAPAFLPDRPLRVLHITDIHVERMTKRERYLLELVELSRPDLIVLTGDYVNVDYLNDPQTTQDAHRVLAQLHAPYGVYAVLGTVDDASIVPALFDGLDIHVLDDQVETLTFPGGKLSLLGVNMQTKANKSNTLAGLMKQVPAEAYTLLLYHSPDLVEAASQEHVDLYLAGHTHGGQIRAPFYGAIITFSKYGKQYEMGEYHVGGTMLYVSRGVGLEGLGLPRMRFLCPPEIELFELGPQ
jgi:predicted MPP superfamily phosphohydrolase